MGEENGQELPLFLLNLRDLRIACDEPVVKISYKKHEENRIEATKTGTGLTAGLQNDKNHKNDFLVG